MDKDYLLAIAELWKVGIVVFLVVGVVMFRNEIKTLVKNFNEIRFKKGDTEVVFGKGDDEQTKLESVSEILSNIQINEINSSNEGNNINNSTNGNDTFYDAYLNKDIEKLKTNYQKIQDSEYNVPIKLDRKLQKDN